MTSDAERDPGELADRVRDRALQVPGVLELTAGLVGDIATYLPGRAVGGVRIRGDRVEIHVVVGSTIPIPDVAAALAREIRALGVADVDIYIDDLRDAEEKGS